MDKDLGKYDPDDVVVDVGGRTIQGFSEDEHIRTERLDENEFSVRVGARGHFTFQKNNNKAGAFIFVLKQNSDDNVYLQSLKTSDSLFSTAIRARHSYQELASGTSCMIGIAPRKTYAAGESDREWNIVTGELIEDDKAL